MEEVEVVDLREGSGVVDTRLGSDLLEVAVRLDGVLGGAQVGVDGVSTAGGCWVLQLHVLARSGNHGVGNLVQVLLHLCKLNVQELLVDRRKTVGLKYRANLAYLLFNMLGSYAHKFIQSIWLFGLIKKVCWQNLMDVLINTPQATILD